MRLIYWLFFSLGTAVFVACGGSSGDADPSSPNAADNPPTTSADMSVPDHRVTIQAAAIAATTPVTGVSLPQTPGGEIFLNPFEQFWTFFPTSDGRYFGLSRPGATLLVAPTSVKAACFFSHRVGWGVNGGVSRACGPIVDHFATLPRTCNNDTGTYAVILKGALKPGKTGIDWQDWHDGEVLWADFVSERQHQFAINPAFPLEAKRITSGLKSGLIEYGKPGVGYRPATVRAEARGVLTLDFGSNCTGGFGLDGKLTNIDPTVPDVVYKFVWNSPKANAAGSHGWGIIEVRDASGRVIRRPSVKEAFLTFNPVTESWEVRFEGLACNDFGNITVYRGANLAGNVIWDPGIDARGQVGFGAGWFVIESTIDSYHFWSIAPGLPMAMNLFINRFSSQLFWTTPGCTT